MSADVWLHKFYFYYSESIEKYGMVLVQRRSKAFDEEQN